MFKCVAAVSPLILAAFAPCAPAPAAIGAKVLTDCDGVRVTVVCCGNDGEYHWNTHCILMSAWTTYWNTCAGGVEPPIPMPSCPNGDRPFGLVTGSNSSCGSGHGWVCDGSEASWIQVVDAAHPLTPNCHTGCVQPCWENCFQTFLCAPWTVKCQNWI